MKKISFVSILFILTITTLNSCKKFEDDEGFSLKSKKSRFSHTWKVEKIYNSQNIEITIKDFIDLMAEKEINYFGITPTLKFEFKRDFSMNFIIGVGFVTTKNPGVWAFIGDDGVNISVEENTQYSIPSIDEEYRILKITSSELFMEYTKNNNIYKINLKRTK